VVSGSRGAGQLEAFFAFDGAGAGAALVDDGEGAGLELLNEAADAHPRGAEAALDRAGVALVDAREDDARRAAVIG
jgi:hypothetical protein